MFKSACTVPIFYENCHVEGGSAAINVKVGMHLSTQGVCNVTLKAIFSALEQIKEAIVI